MIVNAYFLLRHYCLNDTDLGRYEKHVGLIDDATHFCDDVELSYDLDNAFLPWHCGRQLHDGDVVYDANDVTYGHG